MFSCSWVTSKFAGNFYLPIAGLFRSEGVLVRRRVEVCYKYVFFPLSALNFGLRSVPNALLINVHFIEVLHCGNVDLQPAVIVLFSDRWRLKP